MTQVSSAEVGTGEFTGRTEPFRRELLVHCYRMLGSLDDAEDVVQETYLRAWRAYGGFEGRSSVRTWLYQIATNACLTALTHRGRRVLPSGLGGPSDDPYGPPVMAGPEVSWVQPLPDSWLDPEAQDPASIVTAREGLRLAMIACLQLVPARQRAVLILRDVLAWPAAEVAALLGITTPAVKSMLQRARARLEELAPAADQVEEPTAPEARAVLDAYIAAFENSDAKALEQLLHDDATLEASPARTWFAGLATCAPFLAAQAMGVPGYWRMVVIGANGQPAVAVYRRDDDGVHRAFGVSVLSTTATHITRIMLLGDPALVTRFGLPDELPST